MLEKEKAKARLFARNTNQGDDMKYKAINIYGIGGESNHKTPEAALTAADKREGDGWIVTDENGNRWDRDGRETVQNISA